MQRLRFIDTVILRKVIHGIIICSFLGKNILLLSSCEIILRTADDIDIAMNRLSKNGSLCFNRE